MKLRDIRLKQVRLLPVVILAGAALLLLKSTGIMTGGGYVLTGPSPVFAAGGGGGHAETTTDESGEMTLALPVEPTMVNEDPVLDDQAPTLPLRAGAAGQHGEAAEHGETAESDAAHGAEPADAAHGVEPEAAHGGDAATAAAEGCPPVEVVAPHAAPAADGHGPAADELEGFNFIKEREDCVVDPGVNEHGDALPMIKDGAGNRVPLGTADGQSESENAVLERLSARREELDLRDAELEMRMALVEAAEKRLEERTSVLEALEARINAMVDEKRTLEEAQFVGVVAMYETMKPKDAAAIFDELEMSVLLRVARAINPRKMAPIMAKMRPLKAKELTAGLAVDQVEPTIEMTGEDLAALPQIIGQ